MRLRLKNDLPTVQVMHAYEVRPRKDHRGVDLISDALGFSVRPISLIQYPVHVLPFSKHFRRV
jgi:hypothetical protein